MNENLRFHLDPDAEADALTAYIVAPRNPPPITTCQDQQDLPYVARSLLRRAQVLEHLWYRLIGESLKADTAKLRGELSRQAHAANRELMTVQSALYKIQRDMGLACIRPTELLLADAPPPPTLNTRERVLLEDQGDAIFDAEFKALVTGAATETEIGHETAPHHQAVPRSQAAPPQDGGVPAPPPEAVAAPVPKVATDPACQGEIEAERLARGYSPLLAGILARYVGTTEAPPANGESPELAGAPLDKVGAE